MTEEDGGEEIDDGIHFGVHCLYCYHEIDLTATNSDYIIHNGKHAFDPIPSFEITCWNCDASNKYHDSDVKPLENWKDAEKALDRRITALEKIVNSPQFKSDVAKRLLRHADAKARRVERAREKAEQQGR